MSKKTGLAGLALLALLTAALAGCAGQGTGKSPDIPAGGEEVVDMVSVIDQTANNKIRITAPSGQTFEAVLEENRSAAALQERMPLELEMSELNGNEKYWYFDEDFPTDPSVIEEIRAGDLMLYGSDCLVLFYQDRQNDGYAYTRLGRIENTEGLAKAVGARNITLRWENVPPETAGIN